MTKKELIRTATELKPPSPESLIELGQQQERMVAELNAYFLGRADLPLLVGKDNAEMMVENHRNHIRFMISLFGDYHPEVFAETVLWVFRAYRSHGFQLTYWPAQLDKWVEVMKSVLSAKAFEEIYPFYHWMIVNNPVFARISDHVLLKNQDIGGVHGIQESID